MLSGTGCCWERWRSAQAVTALPHSSRTSLPAACKPGSPSLGEPYPPQTSICQHSNSPPELQPPALQHLPKASENPGPARHAPRETHAKCQDRTQRQKQPAHRPPWLWGDGVGNTRPKCCERWAARHQWPLVDKDTQPQHPAVPSNTCLPLHSPRCAPHTHTCHECPSLAPGCAPLLLHRRAAAAPRGAQAPCWCLRQAGRAGGSRGGTVSVTRRSHHRHSPGCSGVTKFTVCCSPRPSLPPGPG